ncbi:MAG: hypothetical protein IKO93_16220 [Lentisphaeria bacterium]|nr:hypothetical protein [Lentisphaeria bacterium]
MINDWNFLKVYAILLALCAQICFVVEGVDVHRKMPKPAWQLEKELKALRQESEKKLAVLTNERDRLRSEVKTLQEENSLIRKELIETLEKYSMLAEKLKRLERSAAAVIETLKPVYSDVRADESAESLRTVMQSSVALASAAAAFCGEVEKLIALPGMDSVRAAKLRVMITQIRSQIRTIIRYNTPPAGPQGITTCRILKIDEKLKAAVFSAGYRNGLRAGMVLRTADGKATFQIILLKDFTSAGLFLTGAPRDVSIGTELLATGSKTATKQ